MGTNSILSCQLCPSPLLSVLFSLLTAWIHHHLLQNWANCSKPWSPYLTSKSGAPSDFKATASVDQFTCSRHEIWHRQRYEISTVYSRLSALYLRNMFKGFKFLDVQHRWDLSQHKTGTISIREATVQRHLSTLRKSSQPCWLCAS